LLDFVTRQSLPWSFLHSAADGSFTAARVVLLLRMTVLRSLAFCAALAVVESTAAARIELPLRVSLETLREALATQLSGTREGPCRWLNLETPKLASVDGRLRLEVPGTGALGVELGGKCQTAAAWQGTMHFTLAPQVDGAGRLRVRILSSRLVDAKGGAAPLFWDLGKRHLHPRLERFFFDLGASREALTALLRSAAPPLYLPAMEQALQQLQILQPRVEAASVGVPIAFEVPDAWLAPPPPASASRAPLTEAEVEALEKALEPLDAFLVYVVRNVAIDGEDAELRRRLFTLLLDSRYQLSGILSGDLAAPGDPVRALFLDAWSELRTILLETKRYSLFIDASDVLVALETAAPGLPLSADGLRGLARSLKPGAAGDPLAYAWDVDRELGRLFGVDEVTDTEREPSPPPTRSWLDFLIPRAHAQATLERWVPTREELASYEARIGALLRKTSADELQRVKLASPYDRIYRHLVPTTALIESCWRQYVARGGKVTYLRSQSSSVGIMQINQRVWRGFYDIERVRWDTAYNIRAGAQILLRYLKDYAIPFAERTGEPDHVARAAYAVYNAGPRAVGRFTKSPPHPREARVDEKLWTLYDAIASGGDVDLASCGVKPLKKKSASH
jgi:hypothetical protein